MNEIIPNAFQSGSTIYVDGVPAKIINGSITLEQHFDEYRDENYMLVREPNRLFTCTGKLYVLINLPDGKRKAFGQTVNVQIGSAIARFANKSGVFTTKGLFMSLVASQTKFVPVACPEEVPEKLPPALAALPLGKN